MTPKTTGTAVLLILALLAASAGCTAPTGPTTPATVLTPEPLTPLKTPVPVTPLPAGEIARIEIDRFGPNASSETGFELTGKVLVRNGPYQSVQVIIRYPDGQEYLADLGGMGAGDPSGGEFSIFPSDQYKGTSPEKIIVLDKNRYVTTYLYDNRVIAWVAMKTTP